MVITSSHMFAFSFWWKVPRWYMALEQIFVSARTIKRHHHPGTRSGEIMGQEKRRNVLGGKVPQSGRGRPERAGRGDTAVRRLGGDRVDKEPDTALLPSSKDVQEVGDENGR
jgi:hypothetical protein